METKGFKIISEGEKAVGIFPAQWELTGGFIFNDRQEMEEFMGKIKEAFEVLADDAYVETFEEAREKLYDESQKL